MSKSSKGSAFERDFCKQLSLWWSDGERDDIFWRTAGSGARACTRRKTGRSTFGQCGDVQATDPIGQPFIDLFTIELKRGYSKDTFVSLFDALDNAAVQKYEKFITQAVQDHTAANSFFWMLVTKRDRRKALLFIPYYFIKKLISTKSISKKRLRKTTCGRLKTQFKNNVVHSIFIIASDDFFSLVKPKYLKAWHREIEQGE